MIRHLCLFNCLYFVSVLFVLLHLIFLVIGHQTFVWVLNLGKNVVSLNERLSAVTLLIYFKVLYHVL